ncbi:MAG TPA: hypothetical protein ENK19_01875 [Acidobacteria bacterium]|nr:hypothetical protein [Acidobacteriota bacterium]
MVIGWLGFAVSLLFSLAMQGVFLGMMPKEAMKGVGFSMVFILGFIVIAPILLLIGLFISSLIVHLFLWIAGGAERGLDTTLRVLAYSYTAQLASVIPMVGGIIAAVWAIVLQIIGLAEAHGTTRGKAALAVLLPFILCCACVVLAIVFSGAALVSALTGAAHH